MCVSTGHLGDADAPSSLRTTVLEYKLVESRDLVCVVHHLILST